MHSVLTVLAALGMAADPVPSPRASAESALVGSWRLVSNEEHRADGSVTAVWGRSPGGSLMYQANGRMAVQLMDPRRRNFASEDRVAGTPEEVKQAFAGYLAYFGSFRVDEAAGVVIHHVEGATFPNLIGTEQRRLFVLSGNRLTLTTPPLFRAGRTSTYVLVWEREP
jgi:hypothetical protein